MLAASLLTVTSARAYGEFTRFGDAPERGGGGGRWFTGAPRDGYLCDVCHADATPLDLHPRGLPERYTPGTAYEIEMQMPSPSGGVVALLEVTDAQGASAGALGLVDRSTLAEDEICEPRELAIGATTRLLAPAFPSLTGRDVIGFSACGATRMRFVWAAPAQDVGTLRLSGGVVAADEKPSFDRRDLLNDRFAHLAATIPSPSSDDPSTIESGGCSTLRTARRGAVVPAVLLMALLHLLARARSRRDRRPARSRST